MKNQLLLCLVILLAECQTQIDLPIEIDIDRNWQFKQTTDSIWYSASVPGNVFSDLLQHQLIEDPFVGDNEAKVQWVSEKDWEYKTTFELNDEVLDKNHIQLNFEGLDTYASVYLNDSLILQANNAFRQWKVNVKSIVKPKNKLRILFESPTRFEENEKAKLPYELPEGNRVFTRKAQFQYGWDWGPKLNTLGIWRPIRLNAWNDLKINDVYIQSLDFNDSIAKLNARVELELSNVNSLYFDVLINDSLVLEGQRVKPHQLHFIPFQVKNPKLWWPHNIGEPYLYNIKIIARHNDQILDSVSVKHGIRDIRLVTEKDSIGESFYFKVNGKPIYAKGANYIPQHSFQSEVGEEQYEKLLNDVVDANMNMLRVWGGGIYENVAFYDLCDEKGILVWQDFMFACAMYPGDDAFLENVKQEAIDNVKRLRNHPSIALWCGNNENSEGWHRWGWQSGRSQEEKDGIWENYLKVFDSILPTVVETYSDTDYWETSPKYGRGNPNYKTEGDAHDWWVWHDAYPFKHLEDNVPRFMSEFGFQSYPSYEVINYINQNDSINISSAGFKNHQKHTRGFELIGDYMQRNFPVPKNAEDYVYMSQLLQAYGITKGIEAHRRAKPYNMGTLYWQLNDCWPAVSWSSIDFLGNWKALHYKAKRSFEDVLVSSKLEEGLLQTWIVNDELTPITKTLSLQILDFDGNETWRHSDEVNVGADESKLVFEIPLDSIDFQKDRSVLVSNFKGNTSYFYFVKPKDLKLKNDSIQTKITKVVNGFDIELKSKTLQKGVFLYTDVKGHFSDNFFDLVPSQKKKVHFKTDAIELGGLKLKSLNSFSN
jgi:beta-mannosidase